MRRGGQAALLVAMITAAGAAPAVAQSDPPASHLEIGAGVLWAGSQPLGSRSATETTGTGGSTPLFSATSELSAVAGVAVRVGVRLTRSLAVEGDASYLRPALRVALSADSENASPLTATESTQQYTVGGKALWFFQGSRSPRFEPFAMVGGGYLRQLHEQATLVQPGHFYQFGGGISALLVTHPHLHTKGAGVRVDVSALVRAKGVAFDGGSKTSPAAGVSAFARF